MPVYLQVWHSYLPVFKTIAMSQWEMTDGRELGSGLPYHGAYLHVL